MISLSFLKKTTSKYKSIFFVIFFLNFLNVNAQVSSPKYSNEFLTIGVGARALGMNNSQVAIVGDVTSGYWNPAGLINMEKKYETAYMHSEYFAGIAKYDYASIGTKLDSNSALSLSYIRFGVDDIPDTRFLYNSDGSLDYDKVRYFSATDNAFLLSYAKKNFKINGLRVGVNFKIVYRNVGTFANAWGFGLDAGAQYTFKKIKLGAVIRDVTSTYNFWSINSQNLNANNVLTNTGNVVPTNSVELTLPRAIIGGGYYFQIKEKIGLLSALDFDMTFDGKRNAIIKSNLISLDPKLGLEADYTKKVFLRAGIGNIQKIDNKTSINPNFGIGVKVNKLNIDYALTTLLGLNSNSLYSNVISLRISF